jgi:hypothetical protein
MPAKPHSNGAPSGDFPLESLPPGVQGLQVARPMSVDSAWRGIDDRKVNLRRLICLFALAATFGIAMVGVSDVDRAGAGRGFKLCVNPDRNYFVYEAKNIGCSRARAVARRWRQKWTRSGGVAPNRVYSYRCSNARSGIYWGLFGARVTCVHARKRVRITSRGE